MYWQVLTSAISFEVPICHTFFWVPFANCTSANAIRACVIQNMPNWIRVSIIHPCNVANQFDRRCACSRHALKTINSIPIEAIIAYDVLPDPDCFRKDISIQTFHIKMHANWKCKSSFIVYYCVFDFCWLLTLVLFYKFNISAW